MWYALIGKAFAEAVLEMENKVADHSQRL